MCICAYFHTLFRWRPSRAFDRWGGGWIWDYLRRAGKGEFPQ